MSSATDTELLALHGLAGKKAGGPAAAAAVIGAEEAEVEASLEAAVAAGRAAGAKGTFMVSPAGREWLAPRSPEFFADFRPAPAATETYERFEKINRELLALFTDWQMIPAAG